ncbi:helix-turn-helix transcriptional regulator [Streptomyces sp. Li-HN-5-11]|uniref:helix-turn-helix domain-containing protein n=1 Tax=Streptomyces sp. Li-HN-5-11 TaxID=3075432 RepID=UPI0028AC241D|nr:helix-turn-helix transcriptional regulator [Streptomyces sp. Li-HN-5-11]WNM35914.1 helix-turn-helix transcriptional regulator [Streptomyces sp. Li-HN-5-11]
MPPRKEPDASANVPSFYGAELRYKRELAGLTLERLAEGSFRGVPFLSQIERGERRMPLDLARHVDKVLETDGFFERRCEDARRARQSGHAEYFADVAEMEQHAETIEEWAPHLLPGLLQTRTYARRVVESGRPWLRAETVEKQVTARMERATLWTCEDRPEFWAIVREELIRKPLLPPEQMAEQLEHMVQVVRSTQGVLQVLPETATAHPLMMGMIKVMTFPDAPPVVYTEGVHSGQLIDFPALVKDYRRSYDHLRAAALSPEASLDLIERAAKDYRDGKHRA